MLADAASALKRWYEIHGRDLPWRHTQDSYAIWLSEIMLQQTQVKTVLPYYNRFLSTWPTVHALAQAPLSDVLKAWEGLGYYARCRNLHRAAQVIVEEHNGVFPSRIEDVIALPGIGRSTAGAILTFSMAQRHPLLDGNVKRVLSRMSDEDGVISKAAVERRLWALSQSFLDAAEDAWTHNQAIMELGASLCSTRTPECGDCPVGEWCKANENGTQLSRPVKKARKPVPHYDIGVGVVYDERRQVLIQLRPPEGLLGGLWEFPGGKREDGEAIERTVRRELSEELGIDVEVNELIGKVNHAYSHFKITLHAYQCTHVSGVPEPKAAVECRWVQVADLVKYAFPKANKSIIEQMVSSRGG